jgi:hypothetical protein
LSGSGSRKYKARAKRGVPCIPVGTVIKIGYSIRKNARLTGKQTRKIDETILARSCPIVTRHGKRKLSKRDYNTRVRLMKKAPGYS